MGPPLGHRERKKQRTREAILAAALARFDERGFHATTIPEIAEAAGVSPRTVSSYFPAKEDLVFPETEETFERLASRLADREPGETAVDALRAWIADEAPRWDAADAQARIQRRIVASEETLQAHEQHHKARAQRMVAAAIADDLGASIDDLEPQMAAAATFAVLEVLGRDVEEREARVGDVACIAEGTVDAVALLDRALIFVAAGVRALQDDPPGMG
ncbi:MAG: TetR/AcrR family transcriptional regulator [Solirubrobacteraceae bacterium]|nr:TetR/AcrR family transcriptional regulator [Solirubrobacteraceae bacterium]